MVGSPLSDSLKWGYRTLRTTARSGYFPNGQDCGLDVFISGGLLGLFVVANFDFFLGRGE